MSFLSPYGRCAHNAHRSMSIIPPGSHRTFILRPLIREDGPVPAKKKLLIERLTVALYSLIHQSNKSVSIRGCRLAPSLQTSMAVKRRANFISIELFSFYEPRFDEVFDEGFPLKINL